VHKSNPNFSAAFWAIELFSSIIAKISMGAKFVFTKDNKTGKTSDKTDFPQ
jgi:hypothetical protein